MKQMIFITGFVILATLVVVETSCTSNSTSAESGGNSDGDSDDEIDRPNGWEGESHGKDATPAYDIVFSQTEVKRIDIIISPDNWQAMLDDMTELQGEFGASGGAGGAPGGGDMPAMDTTNCEDKAEGDSCTLETPMGEMDGVCTTMSELICMPDFDDMSEQGDVADGFSDMAGGAVGGMVNMDSAPDPVWVPCTVQFEDREWTFVGVRFKGNSTIMTAWGTGTYKLPFKLDFDEYEKDHPEIEDQRFFGFKKLSFASNGMDNSYLRDKIAGDLFREGGVAAPMRSFYRVFWDVGDGPVYWGLYTMAEVPAKPMFDAQFGESGGNLYKPTGEAATWLAGYTIDEESFPLKSDENETAWQDVANAIDALNADRTDAEAWREGLEAHLKVDVFLKWLAINTVIQDGDTYGSMAHNYYLYGDPGDDGRLVWIPWDHNLSMMGSGTAMAMGSGLALDMSNVSESWPLIRYLIDDEKYAKDYRSYVEQFADGVFNIDDMAERLNYEHDLIAPYVIGDDGETAQHTAITDTAAFESAVEELISHVENRQAAVSVFLGN